MNWIKQTTLVLLIGGYIFFAPCGNVMAQMDLNVSPKDASTKAGWEEKVLRRRPRKNPRADTTSGPAYRVAQRSPHQPPAAEYEKVFVDSAQVDMDLPPMSSDGPMRMSTVGTFESGPGCNDCGECDDCGECGQSCDTCGPVYDSCGPYDGYQTCFDCWGLDLRQLRSRWWARDFSLFGGVHGFKGPIDMGRNGNFGIHEGLNWGMPLGGPFGVGWQVGFNAVHSNFLGDQVDGSGGADRNQTFFTAGIFRRAICGGWQWGVAFDLVRDNYYEKSSLKQIRSESGYVFAGGKREIGYFGAYGTGDDEFIFINRPNIGLEPTDMFAVYYRRYLSGGEGRVWAGFSGNGDGLLGAEIRVPIGKSWALENQINYLLPKQGSGSGGQSQESWGMSMQVVWYMGQPARCVGRSPFRPMFRVADNSWFMSDAFVVR